jgi:hypothetical protein
MDTFLDYGAISSVSLYAEYFTTYYVPLSGLAGVHLVFE